ncbi:TetR/AcrR family transcriptional regulator [Clostridium beijerinckii]|uniref:TetR/AcrR family transcriptional regulator n=1 Tax=Clostridium beijerinckii TaxID=1520 RepID=UPI001FA90543|nr:TetR/AcrR family transcriptional regulator [Clostridium beijerinckii]MCI1586139.1 TetR/AcrR family transcriptional regulator [Clostridium beijerinckii]MCI1624176.1 TetR/AcrR family transcriptional regulator [Clostridium beijerinckii]
MVFLARLKNKENEILAAAIDIFFKKGFSGTNMQDIADKAQIGKGTIYEYFRSKDDLFVQALKYDHRNFTMNANQKISQEESFLKKLGKLIELTEHAIIERAGRVSYYITNEISELNPEAKRDLENFIKDIKRNGKNITYNILKQGIEEGAVMDTGIDIDFATNVIGGMVALHCHRTCHENYYSVEQRREENEKLINFIMGGIGAKKN